jgi:uncharacterized protein (DUF433 family)
MTVVAIEHIFIDETGVARIGKTRFKVIHLLSQMVTNRRSAEELLDQFSHFSPSKVHTALAYYYDHQREIDDQIACEAVAAEEARLAAGSPTNPCSPSMRI